MCNQHAKQGEMSPLTRELVLSIDEGGYPPAGQGQGSGIRRQGKEIVALRGDLL